MSEALHNGESPVCKNARFRRGLWLCDTLQLIKTKPYSITWLLSAAREANITDVYLYMAPTWYEDHKCDVVDINVVLNQTGIRTWALDGDRAYFEDEDAQEDFMTGLKNLVAYNENVESLARFHGFHSNIDPQDTTDPSKQGLVFYNGIADSKLTPSQVIQRDIVMHKWLNVHTRTSNFLQGNELPYSAAMPFWLHDHQGEPIMVNWPTRPSGKTCVMNLVMPLVDEYVVMSYSTDPAIAAGRVEEQAKYATHLARKGSPAPRVLGAIENAKSVSGSATHGDMTVGDSTTVMLRDMTTIEGILDKFPAFAGVIARQPASIGQMLQTTNSAQPAVPKSRAVSEALDVRFSSVIQKLENLKGAG